MRDCPCYYSCEKENKDYCTNGGDCPKTIAT